VTKRAQEIIDYNLFLGPDDLWHAVQVEPVAETCRDESECEWQPWCRIEGRCKRNPKSVDSAK
jgi:hypothetical protein